MSTEIEVFHNGDLAPYSPGTVAPITPADGGWGEEPDYLSNRSVQPLQDPQVEQNIQQIANVFETDMASLGFVNQDIQKCISFFRQSLSNPITRMPAKRHSYPMWQFSHDIQFMAFCNFAHTQRFAPELIQSVAYWLQQLEDFQHGAGRFAGQQVQSPAYSTDPTDQLTDSQYEAVLAANNQAIANTLGYLRDLWGSSYEANLALVKKTFAALPVAEQEHLPSTAQAG